LLQGGGVHGTYQAGVYQAMAEVDLHPIARCTLPVEQQRA
jgi:predicted acylesterase/phospholipase RssA